MALFFMSTTIAFALSMKVEQEIEPSVLVAAITPVVVWAVTKLFTWLWPKIPTAIVFLVVTILSWAYTQVSGLFEAGEVSYILQIFAGVASVFLNEFLKLAGAQSSLTTAASKRGVTRLKKVA